MWLFFDLLPPLWWQGKGLLATHVPKTREAEERAEGERLCSAVESKEPPVPIFRKNSKSMNC